MVERFPIRCPVSRQSPPNFDFTQFKITGYKIMFPCGLEGRELAPQGFVFSPFGGSSSAGVQTGLATFTHLLVSSLVCALIHFSELKTIHCEDDYPLKGSPAIRCDLPNSTCAVLIYSTLNLRPRAKIILIHLQRIIVVICKI